MPCLELQLGLKLNHPRGSIASGEAGPQDTRRWLLQITDLPERRVRNCIIWETKIRVIEEVEKLQADSQRRVFPSMYLGFLHDCEISVEVTRPTKPITPLGEGHRRTLART